MVKVLLVAFGMLVPSMNIYANTEEVPCTQPIPQERKRVAFGIRFFLNFRYPGIQGRCENDFPKRDIVNTLKMSVLPDFKQDACLMSLFVAIQREANMETPFTLEKMCIRIPDDQNYDKNRQWLNSELDGVTLAGYSIAECEVRKYPLNSTTQVNP